MRPIRPTATAPAPVRAPGGLLLAVALLGTAVCGGQVLATRLFSIMLSHDFAYLLVAVMLLGFAAGGTLLLLAPWLARLGGDKI